MILSLRSKNLNSKIKEINVLLNFTQMFNERALGYTAHIETVVHFLPKLEQAYRDRWFSRPQLSESSDHPLTMEKEERRPSLLHSPREKKSHDVRSEDLGDQCRSTQSTFLTRPIHLLCRVAFRYCFTLRLQ